MDQIEGRLTEEVCNQTNLVTTVLSTYPVGQVPNQDIPTEKSSLVQPRISCVWKHRPRPKKDLIWLDGFHIGWCEEHCKIVKIYFDYTYLRKNYQWDTNETQIVESHLVKHTWKILLVTAGSFWQNKKRKIYNSIFC